MSTEPASPSQGNNGVQAPMINQRIIEIMREVGAIGKERKNAQQGYNFRGIDDAMNALHHLFAKHGVFTTTKVLEQAREERQNKSGGVLIYSILKIKFTFHALDGSTQECEMIGEGMDSGDKASNKSLSVALKYALLQMFMIPTQEFIDPENDSHEPKPRTLPATGKLPDGSYQMAATPKTPPVGNPGAIPVDWRDVECPSFTGPKLKGYMLVDLGRTDMDALYEEYGFGGKPTTVQGKAFKAALLAWKGEIDDIP